MALNKRQWLIGGSLVLTLIATVMAPKPDDAGVVQPLHGGATTAAGEGDTPASTSVAASTAAAPVATDSDLHVLALLPRRGGKAITLFVTPPPPRPVRLPIQPFQPAAPVEPPLPSYSLIGRYDSGSGPLLLLVTGKDTVEAQVGDTVGNGWRIKSINDDDIVFVSPAGHEQLLPTGDGQ